MRNVYFLLFLLGVFFQPTFAQQPFKPSSSEIYHELQKLNFLGSVLYIAAHPDDENTRLISYFANNIHARTAYLSLTRGDGGQNLIGPEIREQLGVIRTQELLAARRQDGGEQFFSRANDFGYSKHPDETLEIWNKEEVLRDVVKVIRAFKPDIIVNRFNHRTPGSTHGHHTTSAMLSVDAYAIVNDSTIYPESARKYGTWLPKNIYFNTSWWFYGSQEAFDKADKTNLLEFETGNYFTNIGKSNGEIAALSRSMHKSQGFGSTGNRGSQTEYLELIKGELPSQKNDPFSDINTTWTRLPEGKAILDILKPIEEDFNFKNPATHLPKLLEAYQKISSIKDDYWRVLKTKQIKNLIEHCSGLFLEAVANKDVITPSDEIKLTLEAISRNAEVNISLESATLSTGESLITNTELLNPNIKLNKEVSIQTSQLSYTTPYWLNKKGTLGMYEAPDHLRGAPETPRALTVTFSLMVNNIPIQFTKNIVYKFNDPVKGEVYRPLDVLPEFTSSFDDNVYIFASQNSKTIQVTVTGLKEGLKGVVRLKAPKNWIITPKQHEINITKAGEKIPVSFTITPPKEDAEAELISEITSNGKVYSKTLYEIDYDHIPYQRLCLPSKSKVVHMAIEKRGTNIGYISGAGDAIPESLEQIGYTVTHIAPQQINTTTLMQYDAVVLGVRAFNTVPELAYKNKELHSYVKNGGTVLVQYNTSHRLVTKDIAPYPITLSRDRVTDEKSDVKILQPEHPVLKRPNTITEKDFDGWVQERGLYFPNEWDNNFTPLLEMNDSNYPKSKGALLVAPYGEGYFIYTGLSFFRELPAGVSGAYKLFANLLSIGKTNE